jgi:hypothetical protein
MKIEFTKESDAPYWWNMEDKKVRNKVLRLRRDRINYLSSAPERAYRCAIEYINTKDVRALVHLLGHAESMPKYEKHLKGFNTMLGKTK